MPTAIIPSANPPYSYRDYTVGSGDIDGGEAALSYGTMAMFDNSVIAHSTSLVVTRTRAGVTTTLTLTTDYTVDATAKEITLLAPQANDTYRVTRSTTKSDRLVDWENNSLLDEVDLDKDSLQAFFMAQEALDSATSALSTEDNTDANACWDGDGREACNFSAATGGNSLTTLSQVQGLISGETPADIDDVDSVFYTGDGSTTAFTFTGVTATVPADQMFITIDGIMQDWDTGDSGSYTVSNAGTNPVITFAVAPPNGSRIAIRTIKGTFLGSFADDTIDGDSLIDDSVDVGKLSTTAGDANRIITIDANGDATVTVLDHEEITDFDAGVRTNRLDQMAAPTASVSFNNQRITSVSTPTASGDAANKSYVDSAVTALTVGTFMNVSTGSITSDTAYPVSGVSEPTMVILGLQGSGAGRDISIRESSGDGWHVVMTTPTGNRSSCTFILPAGGQWKISNTNALEFITTIGLG